jgi:16S rRNA (cytosine1402-N4)-methyltransferase
LDKKQTPKQKCAMHQNQNKTQSDLHVPVLLAEVLRYLDPKTGESYLDLTAGYGGHAAAVLEHTRTPEQVVLVDRDQHAVRELEQRFKDQGVRVMHTDFLQASEELVQGSARFDLILADLGVSSPHLNEASRGFSLSHNGPLDMRMDQTQELTAAQIVNHYSEAILTQILREYGEEPKAAHIAHLIVTNRPFTDTSELAATVAKAWPGHSRVHPATRTFQALRIAVNDELGLVQRSLPLWLDLLKPGGRIAIISFHSLEDRIVKRILGEVSGERYDADFRLLSKRPVTASQQELAFNPRARSAKLRAAVKIKTKEGEA